MGGRKRLMVYDCIIVGGGIAGLQAAIQLGRYEHHVLVIDSGFGRSTLCRSYHNMLGWPDGISGEALRSLGRKQAEHLGVEFKSGEVTHAAKKEAGFELRIKEAANQIWKARTLLLATGLLDRIPNIPGLLPCLGLSVYICPDCDGYEVKNKQTIVLGSGDVGAGMAISLNYWTDEIIYINHERKAISLKLLEKLKAHSIEIISEPVAGVTTGKDWEFSGVQLESGDHIAGERGFIAFGGNQVKSSLAKQLGVERLENRHILTDPRSKMTNVAHVWAAGDVGVHSEQVTIAMGEGSQAAIWIHKALHKMKSIPEQSAVEPDIPKPNIPEEGIVEQG